MMLLNLAMKMKYLGSTFWRLLIVYLSSCYYISTSSKYTYYYVHTLLEDTKTIN